MQQTVRSLPKAVAMAHSPRTVVVAVSGGLRETDLLDALFSDSHDYDVLFVESVARGYSRIKQLKPDLIVLFMAIDDLPACELLSMLAIDRDVCAIPVVPMVTEPRHHALEDLKLEASRCACSDTIAVRMN